MVVVFRCVVKYDRPKHEATKQRVKAIPIKKLFLSFINVFHFFVGFGLYDFLYKAN